jgi:hypothetical protein
MYSSMRTLLCRILGLTGLALALSVTTVEARAGWPFHKSRGTPPPGKPRAIVHTHARAGFPLDVSKHAKPTNTPAYVGYYLGGTLAHGGDGRYREEGTWGWDYVGAHLPRNVGLGWGHGRKYQDGTGAYDPDGHPVPDVIGMAASVLRQHKGGNGAEP